MGNIKQLRAVN